MALPRLLSLAPRHGPFCLHGLPPAHTFLPSRPGHRKPLENYPSFGVRAFTLALGLSPAPPARSWAPLMLETPEAAGPRPTCVVIRCQGVVMGPQRLPQQQLIQRFLRGSEEKGQGPAGVSVVGRAS